MIQAGREDYERSVEDGRLEQSRLVAQTEVVQAAHLESARVLDATSCHHRPGVVGGVREAECREVLRAFFAARR